MDAIFKSYYEAAVSQNEIFAKEMRRVSNHLGYVRFEQGPIKEEEKTYHKYIFKKKSYKEDVNDIIRGSFWDDSLLNHYKVINYFNSDAQNVFKIHEIRDSHYPIFTNGFSVNFDYKEVFFPRLHRDLRIILKKTEDVDGQPVYAELQMHLNGFETINQQTHTLYDKERDLINKLYLLESYFSEDDLLTFFDTRFKTISLNEAATARYNKQAKKTNEKIYLLSGKKVIEKEAQKANISYNEQVLSMLTKGLLDPVKFSEEQKKQNHKIYQYSVEKVQAEYGSWLLSEMDSVLNAVR